MREKSENAFVFKNKKKKLKMAEHRFQGKLTTEKFEKNPCKTFNDNCNTDYGLPMMDKF